MAFQDVFIVEFVIDFGHEGHGIAMVYIGG